MNLVARRRSHVLAPAMVAVAPLVALAVRIVVERPHIIFWGDQALGDIAAGRAVTGRDLLGPYSRYGWHHPGPIWFAMIGVVRWVGFGSAIATMLGVLAVHAVFAVLLVVVGDRIAGRAGAWVAALAALAVLQTLGLVERVAYLWNPWAIVLPTLLLIGLSVLLADPHRSALPHIVALLVVGTFLVQTHAGTLLFVVAVPAAALVLRSTDLLKPPWERGLDDHDDERPRPRRRLDRRGRAFVAAGCVAVFLMWVPPVVQQLTHDPGNLGLVANYAHANHERSPLRVVSVALGTEFRAFPFLKDTPHLYQESDSDLFDGPHRTRFLPYAYLAAAGLLCALAVRRGNRLAATCAAIGGAAVIAGLLSTVLASPPLYPYLVAWMCGLPVPIWAAAAALVGPEIHRRAGAAGRGGAAGRAGWLPAVAVFVVVAVSAACVSQALRDDHLKEHLAFPGGRESWQLVSTRVLSHRGPILLYLADGGTMPVAASIANQVYRRGRTYHVNRAFLFMFGDAARSHGGETLELFFAGIHQTDDPPPPPKAVDLGIVRETHVYAVYR